MRDLIFRVVGAIMLFISFVSWVWLGLYLWDTVRQATVPGTDTGMQLLVFAARAPVLLFFAIAMLWSGAAWWFTRWWRRDERPEDIESPDPERPA